MITPAMILWPIRFAATSYNLRITINSVTEVRPFPSTGSLTVGRNYWLSGDNQADSDGGVGGVGDLLEMFRATIQSHSQAIDTEVELTAAFRTQISGGAAMQFLFSHATSTLDEAIFGFTNATTPGSPATTITSLNMPLGIWRPHRFIGKDSLERQPTAGSIERALSGLQRVANYGDTKKEREIGFPSVELKYTMLDYGLADEPTGTFEYAWLNSIRHGRAFRVYPDETSRTSTSYKLYKTRSLDEPLDRSSGEIKIFWDIDLQMVKAS